MIPNEDRNVNADYVSLTYPLRSITFLNDPILAERILCEIGPSIEDEIVCIFSKDADAWMDIMRTKDEKHFLIFASGQYGAPDADYFVFTALPERYIDEVANQF